MSLARAILIALVAAVPVALHAQARPAGAEDDIPRAEAGANYNYIRANAPPGQCGCFGFNGGSASFAYNLRPAWAAVADLTVAHVNNADNSGQDITIINYLFGVRYTKRNHTRWVPYGEALFGGAKEDVNFEFDINRNSFGLMGGGGVTTKLRDHLGLNMIQVDYVYTQVPNAVNDRQNNLRIATGVIYRFGAP